MDPDQDAARRQIGVLRLVIGAMTAGVLGLTVVAVVVGPIEMAGVAPPPTKLLAGICVALMAVEAVVYVVLRRAMIARVPMVDGRPDMARALQAFFTSSIIGAAMAEGVALLGAIIVLMDGVGLNILLVAVPLAALLIQMPGMGAWESFLLRVRESHAR